MRLGILAYSTHTGLGYQTRDYFNHLKPDKIMHIDISQFNQMPQHYDWYPEDVLRVKGIPTDQDIEYFVKDLDVILMAETPLNYNLYSIARRHGVKTAVAINWEFFDHLVHPEYPHPDMIIMPSMWKFNEAEEFCNKYGIALTYLHHPVDRSIFKYHNRKVPKFLHIAGRPATNDRNGTWNFVNSGVDGVVITQSDDLGRHIRMRNSSIRVVNNIQEPQSMYDYGDVIVLPRKYGGNCLPLNEALSCGLPVIMPNISPNNALLPSEWLVEASVVDSFTPRTKIDIYEVNQHALNEKIEWFRNQDISVLSEQANKIADSISWKTLKPKWQEVLENI